VLAHGAPHSRIFVVSQ
jgi:hypothetical protein